jgi:transcriptional regulator with XRE-family HTH domain
MTDKKKQTRKSVKKQQATSLDALRQEAELIDKEIEEELSRRPPVKFGVLATEPEAELGQRIQEARRGAGLTQEELAERTKRADIDGSGISGAVISLYERGVNRPGPREIRILCEALRITPNHLVYGDEAPFAQHGLNEYIRYWGGARSEGEFYAALTYCFSRLHGHHKSAVMDLMMGLLRGWNKNFDKELDEKAVETFLQQSDELRLELAKKRKSKQ